MLTLVGEIGAIADMTATIIIFTCTIHTTTSLMLKLTKRPTLLLGMMLKLTKTDQQNGHLVQYNVETYYERDGNSNAADLYDAETDEDRPTQL